MIEWVPAKATPPEELERQILSVNEPKNEREWWARARIEALQRENAALRAASTGTRIITWDADGNRVVSSPDHEKDREDAERYRWLRENCRSHWSSGDEPVQLVFVDPLGDTNGWRDRLDDAIDAARKENP